MKNKDIIWKSTCEGKIPTEPGDGAGDDELSHDSEAEEEELRDLHL